MYLYEGMAMPRRMATIRRHDHQLGQRETLLALLHGRANVLELNG